MKLGVADCGSPPKKHRNSLSWHGGQSIRPILGYALLLAGCTSAEVPATAKSKADGDETAASVSRNDAVIANGQSPRAAGMDRATFLAQCRRKWLRYDEVARSEVDEICRNNWSGAQALLPLANAVLRLSPEPGASIPTYAQVRAELPPVDWGDEGFGGQIRGLNAYVVLGERGDAVRRIALSSIHSGSDMERDDPMVDSLADALLVRGVRISNLACTEDGDVISRVDTEGRASFVLEIGSRPQMGGDTSYWASVFFTSSIPDLATLRAGRWAEQSNVEPGQWLDCGSR